MNCPFGKFCEEFFNQLNKEGRKKMSCFPCFGKKKEKDNSSSDEGPNNHATSLHKKHGKIPTIK